MRTLSVTVTVSPLVTGDSSTSIDTMSTGGLAALGVQLKENEVPVIRRAGLRGVVIELWRICRSVHSSTEGVGTKDACMFTQTVTCLVQ